MTVREKLFVGLFLVALGGVTGYLWTQQQSSADVSPQAAVPIDFVVGPSKVLQTSTTTRVIIAVRGKDGFSGPVTISAGNLPNGIELNCDSNCSPGLGSDQFGPRTSYTLEAKDGEWRTFAPHFFVTVTQAIYDSINTTITFTATAQGYTPTSQTVSFRYEPLMDEPPGTNPLTFQNVGSPYCELPSALQGQYTQPLRPANKQTVTAGGSVSYTCNMRAPSTLDSQGTKWPDGKVVGLHHTQESGRTVLSVPGLSASSNPSSAAFNRPSDSTDESQDVPTTVTITTTSSTPAGVYVVGWATDCTDIPFISCSDPSYQTVHVDSILTVQAAQTAATSSPSPSATSTTSSPSPSATASSPSPTPTVTSSPPSATASPTSSPTLTPASSPTGPAARTPNPITSSATIPSAASTQDSPPAPSTIKVVTQTVILQGKVDVPAGRLRGGVQVELASSRGLTDPFGYYQTLYSVTTPGQLSREPIVARFRRGDLLHQEMTLNVPENGGTIVYERNVTLEADPNAAEVIVAPNPALGGSPLKVDVKHMPPGQRLFYFFNNYPVTISQVEPRVDANGNLFVAANAPILPTSYQVDVIALSDEQIDAFGGVDSEGRPRFRSNVVEYGPQKASTTIDVIVPNQETYVQQLKKDLTAGLFAIRPTEPSELGEFQLTKTQQRQIESLMLTAALPVSAATRAQLAATYPDPEQPTLRTINTQVSMGGITVGGCPASVTIGLNPLVSRAFAQSADCRPAALQHRQRYLAEYQRAGALGAQPFLNAWLTDLRVFVEQNSQVIASNPSLRTQVLNEISLLQSYNYTYLNLPDAIQQQAAGLRYGQLSQLAQQVARPTVQPTEERAGQLLPPRPQDFERAWVIRSNHRLQFTVKDDPNGFDRQYLPGRDVFVGARAFLDNAFVTGHLAAGRAIDLTITTPTGKQVTISLHGGDESAIQAAWQQLKPYLQQGMKNRRTNEFTPFDGTQGRAKELENVGRDLARSASDRDRVERTPATPFDPLNVVAVGQPSRGQDFGGDSSYIVTVLEPPRQWLPTGERQWIVPLWSYRINPYPKAGQSVVEDAGYPDLWPTFPNKERAERYYANAQKLGADPKGNVNDAALTMIIRKYEQEKAARLAELDSQVSRNLQAFFLADYRARQVGMTVIGGYAFGSAISQSDGWFRSISRALAQDDESPTNEVVLDQPVLTNYLQLKLEGDPVDLLITDPIGRSVGVHPVSGQFINQIPGATYDGIGTETVTIFIPGLLEGDYGLLMASQIDAATTFSAVIAPGNQFPQVVQLDLEVPANQPQTGAITVTMETEPTVTGLAAWWNQLWLMVHGWSSATRVTLLSLLVILVLGLGVITLRRHFRHS